MSNPASQAAERPKILVFCERINNESFCESVVRELENYYDVRPFGPGWPRQALTSLDHEDVRFYLELDSVSGNFDRPTGLEALQTPKFAWVIDTHKKPDFHRRLSREMDLTFFAMKNWGHVLEGRTHWLPLHCDSRIFAPVEQEREYDVSFVGSYGWRAEPILEIAKKHGLRVRVECTTGPLEKTKTAETYARSKLVFNRHVANDLNFRVFEATACGRVLLTDAQWNGQYELFRDREHLVLYTDEADLEAKVLHYLGDDEARLKIEKAAAEHAARHHTTRARVTELRAVIEHVLSERAAPEPARQPTPRATRRARRWIFFAGDAPKAFSGRTYAESLAHSLAEGGDQVVIARGRRGLLPPREPRPLSRQPRVVELDPGPLVGASGIKAELQRAASFHAAFERLAGETAPDAVVAEGAVGALVGAPVALRREIPFLFALEEPEVTRRENRLTREQLYRAELEQWAVERARAVLVPGREAEEAARHFYKAGRVKRVPKPEGNLPRPTANDLLLSRLGLRRGGYSIAVLNELSDGDAQKALCRSQGEAIAVGPQGVWALSGSGHVTRLSDVSPTPAVLAALIGGATFVTPPRGWEMDDRRPVDLDALDEIFVAGGAKPEPSERELTHVVQ